VYAAAAPAPPSNREPILTADPLDLSTAAAFEPTTRKPAATARSTVPRLSCCSVRAFRLIPCYEFELSGKYGSIDVKGRDMGERRMN
jgi:hypothetical protein